MSATFGQRPSLSVGRQNYAPTAIVAADLVGAVAVFDGGKARQRDPTHGRVDEDAAQALNRPRLLGQANHQREAAVALDDLGDLFAFDQALQRGQNLRCGHAVASRRRIIHADFDLRR